MNPTIGQHPIFPVICLATAVVAIVLSFVEHRGPVCLRWAKYRAAIILMLAVLCVAFSMVSAVPGLLAAHRKTVSTAPATSAPAWQDQTLDAFYLGMQNLVLGGGFQQGDSCLLRAGRMFGVGFFVMVAYQGIARLFAEPMLNFRLRRSRDHVIVCGLGWAGRELVLSCLAQTKSTRVVVVERDENQPDLDRVRREGALVLVGDATDKDVLGRVRADRARHIFLVTGVDERNLDAASRIIDGDKKKDQKPTDPAAKVDQPRELPMGDNGFVDPMPVKLRKLFVQLSNVDLDAVLHRAAGRADASLSVRSFNVRGRTLQSLIDGPLLEHRPRSKDEVAHYIVFGFGEMGQALVERLTELAHFENERRCRMTIVHGPEDATRVRAFGRAHPNMMPNAKALRLTTKLDPWHPTPDLDHWDFHASIADPAHPNENDTGITFVVNGGFTRHTGEPSDDAIVDRLIRLCQDPTVKPAVFVCREDDDESNCTLAIELRQALDARLKVRETDSDQTTRYKYRDQKQRIDVFAYVPRRQILTEIVGGAPTFGKMTDPVTDKNFDQDLMTFGNYRGGCNYAHVTHDLIRPLAELLADDFDDKAWEKRIEQHNAEIKQAEVNQGNMPDPLPAKPVKPRFADRRPWEQHSNLMAAAHLNIKLRVAGLMLVARKESDPPDADLPQMLKDKQAVAKVIARMEHNRWLAERLMAGWQFGEQVRDPENKRRFAFAPWEKLDPGDWVKDMDQLKRALQFCQHHEQFRIKTLPTVPSE